MMSIHNLIGTRFDRWVVLGYSGTDDLGQHLWNCECDCGTVINVRGKSLVGRKSRSCGCYRRERRVAQRVYLGIVASGIEMVPEWRTSLDGFLADMGLPIDKGYTIYRRDTKKPYSKNNCYWDEAIAISKNISVNKVIELNGVSKTLQEWSSYCGISDDALRARFSRGFTPEKALTTPVVKRCAMRMVEHNGITMTLPKYAQAIGVNYRTMVGKLRRGIALADIRG